MEPFPIPCVGIGVMQIGKIWNLFLFLVLTVLHVLHKLQYCKVHVPLFSLFQCFCVD
jgi:hypothetical protein